MEEKKNVKPLNATKEAPKAPANAGIDVAQLQAVMQQMDGKMKQLVENIKQLDQMLRDKTVDQLFSVLKYSVHFDTEFVDKCAKCIETYISNVAFSAPESSEEVEDKAQEN